MVSAQSGVNFSQELPPILFEDAPLEHSSRAFLVGSPFKGSNHVKPLDRKGPCNGDCLEGGGWHVALICKELATGAMLDQVLCIFPGRWPIESCTVGLAYKSPGCGVVTAESGVDFCQKVPPFLFGDAPLKDSGSAFLYNSPSWTM